MTGRRYHDFVILTDDAELRDEKLAAYTVRVLESPTGEGEEKERVEVESDERLTRARDRLARRRLRPNELRELGRELADLLLPPYARSMFWASRSRLGSDEGLRLRLRLLDPLADLPWEYIYLQMEANRPRSEAYAVLDPGISVVRHKAMAIPAQWVAPRDTQSVFVAMATPRPHPVLKELPLEQRRIKEALGKVAGVDVRCLPDYDDLVEGETVPGARLDEMQRYIRELDRVDIFHFGGHGKFDPYAEATPQFGRWRGAGYLILADDNNSAVPVSGEDVAALLSERGVRLVTLGACETATSGTDDAWGSVATAMLEDRIPCVVAMQFTVYSELAVAFLTTIYETLVDGRTIDEAVSQGRAAIRALSYGRYADARDWGTPVLYSRVDGAHILPPVVDERARSQAQERIELRSGLHRAWWDWMAKGTTASVSQLRALGRAEDLQLTPMQALLLLRSAVVEDEPAHAWLTRLRERGADLVAELDAPAAGGEVAAESASSEEAQVLGLGGVPANCPQDVGAVAWAAVGHPDAAARQTAALALAALPPLPDEGLARLDRALRCLRSPWKRFRRKAELRGTLADADPRIAAHNAGNLPPWDRGGAWFWRFWRRVERQDDWIRALVVGAALGAGVALGVQRGLWAIPAGPLAGARFGINLFWGGLLGAAVGLGVGLARPLLLEEHETQKASRVPSRRAKLTALVLGTLLFGLTHALVYWFNGIDLGARRLVLATGTLTGFGVSLALYGLPRPGQPGVGSWLLRSATAAATAVLAMWLVIAAGRDWPSTAVTRTGVHLADNLGRYDTLHALVADNKDLFSYLDAALTAILLTIGIAVGWRLATRRLRGLS
jgi:hypothetical protein